MDKKKESNQEEEIKVSSNKKREKRWEIGSALPKEKQPDPISSSLRVYLFLELMAKMKGHKTLLHSMKTCGIRRRG